MRTKRGRSWTLQVLRRRSARKYAPKIKAARDEAKKARDDDRAEIKAARDEAKKARDDDRANARNGQLWT